MRWTRGRGGHTGKQDHPKSAGAAHPQQDCGVPPTPTTRLKRACHHHAVSLGAAQGLALGSLRSARGKQVQGKGQSNENVLPLLACVGFLSLRELLQLPPRPSHAGSSDIRTPEPPRDGRRGAYAAWREGKARLSSSTSFRSPMATTHAVVACNSSCATACGSGQEGATLACSPFGQGWHRSRCGVGAGSWAALEQPRRLQQPGGWKAAWLCLVGQQGPSPRTNPRTVPFPTSPSGPARFRASARAQEGGPRPQDLQTVQMPSRSNPSVPSALSPGAHLHPQGWGPHPLPTGPSVSGSGHPH